MSLSTTRLGANAPGLPGPAPLPPISAALSRRAALFGAVTVAGVTAAGAVPALGQVAVPSPDAALIAQAAAFRALQAREHTAWGDLSEEDAMADESPALDACHALSEALREAGDALAEVPAATAAGLGAKAAALLTLVGTHLDTQANLMEQSDLVVSVLRDATRLGSGNARNLQVPTPLVITALSDRRLADSADMLDALQAKADRHAAGAGLDPADPYTLAVAEMDLVVAGMAMLPADTMAGVMTKLRALRVSIVGQDEDSPLPLSVCRDVRRLQATGALHA